VAVLTPKAKKKKNTWHLT